MTEVEKALGVSGFHSFTPSEKRGYVEHINEQLAGDPHLNLPISETSDELFDVISEGILLKYARAHSVNFTSLLTLSVAN